MWFVSGGCKMSRSLHSSLGESEVSVEALTGFSHVFSLDGLNTTCLSYNITCLSHTYVLETAPSSGTVGRGTGVGVRKLWLLRASSTVKQVVTPSALPPQHSTPMTDCNNLTHPHLLHCTLSSWHGVSLARRWLARLAAVWLLWRQIRQQARQEKTQMKIMIPKVSDPYPLYLNKAGVGYGGGILANMNFFKSLSVTLFLPVSWLSPLFPTALGLCSRVTPVNTLLHLFIYVSWPTKRL